MGAGDIGRGGNKMLKECVDAETICRVYCHLKQVVFKTHAIKSGRMVKDRSVLVPRAIV